MIPWMSDGKVDYNSHSIIEEYTLNSSLVKLHGKFRVPRPDIFCSHTHAYAQRFNLSMFKNVNFTLGKKTSISLPTVLYAPSVVTGRWIYRTIKSTTAIDLLESSSCFSSSFDLTDSENNG